MAGADLEQFRAVAQQRQSRNVAKHVARDSRCVRVRVRVRACVCACVSVRVCLCVCVCVVQKLRRPWLHSAYAEFLDETEATTEGKSPKRANL